MKLDLRFMLPLILLALGGCGLRKGGTGTEKESTQVFSIGQKVDNGNFTGTVWLQMLVPNDTLYNSNIGSVTFAPGARTKWHYHPGGQILLVTSGNGLYQEKGKPMELIKKGDVVKCPPNVAHWHGATPTDTMAHIAIGTNTQKGNVVWLENVSDSEYKSIE
jgi:quercetin dioxygenase-like cupin family protein